MRRVMMVAGFGSMALAGVLSSAGCTDYAADCEYVRGVCPGVHYGSGGGGATTTSTSGGGGGSGGGGMGGNGGGGGGGVPAGCVPSENDMPVDGTCGVFVSSSSGADSNDGTKATPFATLAAAISAAANEGLPVYACAEQFVEALVVAEKVTIYGGLACANGWGYVKSQKTLLKGGADEVPLRMSAGASGTAIYDLAIQAADATAAGGSSIALIADGVTVDFVQSHLIAGRGAAGAPGAGGPATPPAQPDKGNDGADACSDLDMMNGPDLTLPGGDQTSNDCSPDGVSIGGKGGDGNQFNGNPGAPGQTGAFGGAGTGEPVAGAWSCSGNEPNGTGDGGADGAPGTAGPGGTGPGTLTSSGYVGTSGGAGTAGAPGQGGGGGGGAKGGNAICSGIKGSGASGGSGGAGGCGGQPGDGGGPGGASIALVSVNANVSLTDCALTAAQGGDGGKGGDAQPAALGGLAGLGGTGAGLSLAACAGGAGGQGGNGGPGGGGLGGPSFAIAYTGTAVAKAGTTTLQPGTAGIGGPGGNANSLANAGAAGSAAEEQAL